jgi:hypothetical protein
MHLYQSISVNGESENKNLIKQESYPIRYGHTRDGILIKKDYDFFIPTHIIVPIEYDINRLIRLEIIMGGSPVIDIPFSLINQISHVSTDTMNRTIRLDESLFLRDQSLGLPLGDSDYHDVRFNITSNCLIRYILKYQGIQQYIGSTAIRPCYNFSQPNSFRHKKKDYY